MRLLVKMLALLLVVALVLPLWLRGPDGKPVMEISDWVNVPPQLSRMGAQLGDRLRALAGDAAAPASLDPTEELAVPVQEFYRWQDQSGVWHFSDSPPPDQRDLAAEVLPQLSNSMDAVKIVESEAVDAGTTTPMDSTMAAPVELPEGVSKEAIETMLQESHERRMGEHL